MKADIYVPMIKHQFAGFSVFQHDFFWTGLDKSKPIMSQEQCDIINKLSCYAKMEKGYLYVPIPNYASKAAERTESVETICGISITSIRQWGLFLFP